MHYKTIVLGLIEQQPELYEQLRQSRTMLPTINQLAAELRESHLAWSTQLQCVKPNSDPSQVKSEAMEIAVKELEERFSSGSRPSDGEEPSLEAAMKFLQPHTPRA